MDSARRKPPIVNTAILDVSIKLVNLVSLDTLLRAIGVEVSEPTSQDRKQSYKHSTLHFSLPNGDRLLALWTDGEAVDEDPGIEAIVMLPDFSAKKVTSIDVLHGLEQELIASAEQGSLVIEDLLVRDHPIIIRLTKGT